ncbi:MAG: hypothetical protein EPN92_07180 [Chitinophagaceae bacterium]|nr:MAG: hypothetical protein EPN92_07180 [Chitinophagaceae bacterium]
MKVITTLILSCIFFPLFGQNKVQYLNLEQLDFPSKVDTTKVKDVIYFQARDSNLIFLCIANNKTDDSVYNQKNFYHDLQIIIEGFFSSENWKYHNREQVDTSIGGVEGRLVHGFQPSKPMTVKEFFNFFTIVNGRFYMIMGGSFKDLTSELKEKIDSYFNTLKFSGKNY